MEKIEDKILYNRDKDTLKKTWDSFYDTKRLYDSLTNTSEIISLDIREMETNLETELGLLEMQKSFLYDQIKKFSENNSKEGIESCKTEIFLLETKLTNKNKKLTELKENEFNITNLVALYNKTLENHHHHQENINYI